MALLTLNRGELILWHEAGEIQVFESVADCLAYIRAEWHPKAKQLHLVAFHSEVRIFSAERRLLSRVEARIIRPWKKVKP